MTSIDSNSPAQFEQLPQEKPLSPVVRNVSEEASGAEDCGVSRGAPSCREEDLSRKILRQKLRSVGSFHGWR
ncbi:MAG: hypothetical protein ACLU7P_14285 [Eggerthella lenta]